MSRHPMNRQISRLGIGLLACYLGLFVMVNVVQVVKAEELKEAAFPCYAQGDDRSQPPTGSCSNTRTLFRDFDAPRGDVISADGIVLAETVPAAEGGRFENQRTYPTGDLFAHVTGYLNLEFGSEGVERTFNDDLAGQTTALQIQSVSDLFVDRVRVGDLTLTLRADVQEAARQALGDRRGSVVVLDPRSGAIQALWSFPSFDPNLLSTHDQAAARAARTELEQGGIRSPLVPAAYRRSFFPGSTYKVVVGAVGVDGFGVTDTQPSYPVLNEFDVDFTDDELSNFGGGRCGGPLPDILRVSCNSAFALMGVETIGEAGMVAGAEAFGFNQVPPLDLPAPAASTFPTLFPDDQGNGPLARASIGQGDVSATPLQMALVAAAIANDGVIMAPHVLDRITDDRGDVVVEHEPEVWQSAVSPQAAATMRDAMVGVVEGGSGRNARIDGFVVGGKTGTAQLGTDPPSSHAWFIAFAGPPGQPPTVAIAVMVEAQSDNTEATGGGVAAPIARDVLEVALAGQ